MAIEVTKQTGIYDRFKTKCPHCGTELTYTRNNVRPHNRWPNGFIYCPNCKRPIGHDEANLVESGEEVLKKRADYEGADIEQLRNQIRRMRAPKIVLLAVGIPFLVLGAFLFTVSMTWWSSWGLVIISFLMFNTGLSMTICGGVLSRLIKTKMLMMQSM